jgi:hypothetical protein
MAEAARETVIIVHGTWAAPTPGVVRWYQPGESGGFVSKLDEALRKRGSPARCWAHCTEGNRTIFHWSGHNNWIKRTRAASALADYVAKLRNEGWRCHIVAHSHGGNVALEALPQITAALHPEIPYGQIVTLGTPFMDTVSPILKRIGWVREIVSWLTWIAFILITYFFVMMVYLAVGAPLGGDGQIFITVIALFLATTSFLYRTFGDKSRKNDAPMRLKLLAVGSVMDEPWQILNYLQSADSPVAVKSSLIKYLLDCLRSNISRSGQIARIYGAKSYRDLRLSQKCLLALIHLNLVVTGFLPAFGHWSFLPELNGSYDLEQFVVGLLVGGWALALFFSRMLGEKFHSAFLSPFRWCAHCAGAARAAFTDIATYVVRNRGWSISIAMIMGLEGYRHQLPLIEQYPSSIAKEAVEYENMPIGAEQRALSMRSAWIARHLGTVSETFSKMVVTAADVSSLLKSIEGDQTLVHAAYYTDDECIDQIADWIAKGEDTLSAAAIAAEICGGSRTEQRA